MSPNLLRRMLSAADPPRDSAAQLRAEIGRREAARPALLAEYAGLKAAAEAADTREDESRLEGEAKAAKWRLKDFEHELRLLRERCDTARRAELEIAVGEAQVTQRGKTRELVVALETAARLNDEIARGHDAARRRLSDAVAGRFISRTVFNGLVRPDLVAAYKAEVEATMASDAVKLAAATAILVGVSAPPVAVPSVGKPATGPLLPKVKRTDSYVAPATKATTPEAGP